MLGPVSVTVTTSAGGTAWAWGTAGRSENVVQLDYQKSGYTTLASVVTTSGAGLTYHIEYSNDAPVAISSITGSSQMTWYSTGSSGLSTHAYVAWAFTPRCVRVNATTTTSNQTIALTIIQSQA